MKKKLIIGLLLMTTILSCSKENSDTEVGPIQFVLGNLSAKIDGHLFTSNDGFGGEAYKDHGRNLVITAHSADLQKGFSFGIPNFMGIGEYVLDDMLDEETGLGAYYEGDLNWVTSAGLPVGSMKVTEYKENEYMKGTFYFTGKNIEGNVKNITEGVFDIPIATIRE